MNFTPILLVISVLNFSACKESINHANEEIKTRQEQINIKKNDNNEEQVHFKFDSVFIRHLENQYNYPSQIVVSKFFGFKNDSSYSGILTFKNQTKIDSVYYLHTSVKAVNELPCFYGAMRFLDIKNTTIFSYRVFDENHSCEGGLGEQYVIKDFWHTVDSNGYINLLDTNLNRPTYKLVGGGY